MGSIVYAFVPLCSASVKLMNHCLRDSCISWIDLPACLHILLNGLNCVLFISPLVFCSRSMMQGCNGKFNGKLTTRLVGQRAWRPYILLNGRSCLLLLSETITVFDCTTALYFPFRHALCEGRLMAGAVCALMFYWWMDGAVC